METRFRTRDSHSKFLFRVRLPLNRALIIAITVLSVPPSSGALSCIWNLMWPSQQTHQVGALTLFYRLGIGGLRGWITWMRSLSCRVKSGFEPSLFLWQLQSHFPSHAYPDLLMPNQKLICIIVSSCPFLYGFKMCSGWKLWGPSVHHLFVYYFYFLNEWIKSI